MMFVGHGPGLGAWYSPGNVWDQLVGSSGFVPSAVREKCSPVTPSFLCSIRGAETVSSTCAGQWNSFRSCLTNAGMPADIAKPIEPEYTDESNTRATEDTTPDTQAARMMASWQKGIDDYFKSLPASTGGGEPLIGNPTPQEEETNNLMIYASIAVVALLLFRSSGR